MAPTLPALEPASRVKQSIANPGTMWTRDQELHSGVGQRADIAEAFPSLSTALPQSLSISAQISGSWIKTFAGMCIALSPNAIRTTALTNRKCGHA
ncbi:MAG TPA: hypothetical protein VI306_15275 [Pyrinomonadaceae bacterium]